MEILKFPIQAKAEAALWHWWKVTKEAKFKEAQYLEGEFFQLYIDHLKLLNT